MRPDAFVPDVILERDRGKPWADWMEGSVLFADVSGFTAMAEAVASLGAEGAESLTRALNRYFGAMIGLVTAGGGQVMKFGGDALLCFFPEDGTMARAAGTAMAMQTRPESADVLRTPRGRIALRTKIGVAAGQVLLGAVGDEAARTEFVFAGAPVDRSASAEERARPGDVVIHLPGGAAPPPHVTLEPLSESYHRCLAAPATSLAPRVPADSPRARPFLVPDVYALIAAGHDRHVGTLPEVVPAFLRFSGFQYTPGGFDLPRFHAFARMVLATTAEMQGSLGHIAMGDKGSTILALFGAPRSVEHKESLACQWALDVRSRGRELFPEVEMRVGLHAGRVFAGIVGGGPRFTYTVMGDVVNVAARVMQEAQADQVCATDAVRVPAAGSFDFIPLGARSLKGKASTMELFLLRTRRTRAEARRDPPRLVGRDDELALVASRLHEARRGHPGLVFLEGEPGVGKTALVRAAAAAAARDGWRVVEAPGDVARSHRAYAPFRALLGSMLLGSGPPGDAAPGRALRGVDPDVHGTVRSLLGSGELAGDPLGDDETHRSLRHHRLCLAILSQARAAPLLVLLDDLHAFDTLSRELLHALAGHLRDEPVALLGAARPGWLDPSLASRPHARTLTLGELDRTAIQSLGAGVLGAAVSPELAAFVHGRTHGRPFFAAQLFGLLASRDLLVARSGEWALVPGAELRLGGAETGQDMVLAQLAALPIDEQLHLRMAACIGPAFQASVLARAMSRGFRQGALEALGARGHVDTVAGGGHRFRHVMVQEAVYGSIPGHVRRENHRRIGAAMEQLSPGDAPALARHHHLGGARDRALPHALAAGESLFVQMAYPEAAHHLDVAMRLMRRDDPRRFATGRQLVQALRLAGRLRESADAATRVARAARRAGRHEDAMVAEVDGITSRLHLADYGYVSQARRLLRRAAQAPAQRARLLQALGVAHLRHGKQDSAREAFESILALGGDGDATPAALAAHLYLASIARDQGDLPRALRWLERGTALARSSRNGWQESRLLVEQASVLADTGDAASAFSILDALLPRLERAGDLELMATVLQNRGTIAALGAQADPALSELLPRADRDLREASTMFRSLGIASGAAKVAVILGAILFMRKRHEEAHAVYLDALPTLQAAGLLEEAYLCLYNLAEVSLELGRPAEAAAWHGKGVALLGEKGNPRFEAAYLELGALIAAAGGDAGSVPPPAPDHGT